MWKLFQPFRTYPCMGWFSGWATNFYQTFHKRVFVAGQVWVIHHMNWIGGLPFCLKLTLTLHDVGSNVNAMVVHQPLLGAHNIGSTFFLLHWSYRIQIGSSAKPILTTWNPILIELSDEGMISVFAWQDSESKMNFKTEVVAWCRVGNCVRPIDKNTYFKIFLYIISK